MKKIALTIAFICSLFFFPSCEKDEGKLPNINFKIATDHVYQDKTVGMSDTLTIGIDASKSEDKDVLKTLDASVSFDGAAATSFFNTSLSGSDGDSYSRDFQIITRNQAGTEKYSFTVVNRDGITNTASLTLTVN